MAAVEGVVRAVPVTYLAGLVDDPAEPANPLPVVLKAVAEPPPFSGLEQWPGGGAPVAVLGERLAATLGVTPGAVASVRLPPEPGSWVLPTLGLEVVGTFRLEFAEFDEHWVVVPLDAVLARLPGTGVRGVEVHLEDPMRVDRARDGLEAAAPALVLTDWREMNRSLFAALTWQTRSLFLVLSLVVFVASFQVSSALVVLAIDKRRSTGMLMAIGATPARVRRILVLAGGLLGGSGVALGLAAGSAGAILLSWLRVIRFPEGLARVYMVDHIPLVLSPAHLMAVAVVCGGLVLGASWWPAWRSSRLDPVTALRAV
jgi:lipoprotein-releasing system permease protein